jgi:hypothetical protein
MKKPEVVRKYRVLVFQDSVGITHNYLNIWKGLLEENGLPNRLVEVQLRSAYTHFRKNQILEWHKARKQPGWSTNIKTQWELAKWTQACIVAFRPDFVICQDPSMLFMVNKEWNQGTLDRLRGGTYVIDSIPWLVMLPITAFHTKMKKADIAKLNEGFTEKSDWAADQVSEEDSDDEEDEAAKMEWHEPIVVPYGRAVIRFDLQKCGRILNRIPR